MSTDKWRYTSDCDNYACPGDCDLCRYKECDWEDEIRCGDCKYYRGEDYGYCVRDGLPIGYNKMINMTCDLAERR